MSADSTSALKYNQLIRAAACRCPMRPTCFRTPTAGAFVPDRLWKAAAAGSAKDRSPIRVIRDEVSGKVVVSWDIFCGGQDAWKRAEAGERMIEQQQRHARLQRRCAGVARRGVGCAHDHDGACSSAGA